TVTANFEEIPASQYTLTLAINQSDGGTINPSAGTYTYDEKTVVNITATPADGYQFVSWTGNVENSTSATTTVTINSDMTVTANFEAVVDNKYTLTLSVNNPDWGAINPSSGSHSYEEGLVVTIAASPAAGYRFLNWTGAVKDSINSTTTITVTENMSVTANFEATFLTLSGTIFGADLVTVTLSGDTLDSQIVDDGDSYSFSVKQYGNYVITPSKPGYEFTPSSMTFGNLFSDFSRNFTATEEVPKEMTMVTILAGSFEMGSNDGSENEQPVHTVTFDYSFEMSAYEITQGQYESVVGSNPSNFTGSDNLPVENVDREDMLYFFNRLSDRDGLERCYDESTWECDFTKNGYRLPTEAEWEYACRGGTSTKYYAGDSESDLARTGWYEDNSSDKTHSVGQKEPNAWGLYDMLGNVREWCHDWSAVSDYQGDYLNTSAFNPIGPASGVQPVVRGGGYGNNAGECRSAYRDWYYRGGSISNLGFRVVRGAFTPGHIISGFVEGADGITVALSGDSTDSQTVNDGGSYYFNVVHGGNYVVTPSKEGYQFTPSSKTFTGVTARQKLDFEAIIVRYTLTLAVNQSGWGTTTAPVGDYEYEKGTQVTIKANPAEGYRFVNWTGSVADSLSATTTVTMDGDKTVTAIFEEITYNISGTVNGTDGVTVTLNGDSTTSQVINDEGNYSFSVSHGGSYTVTPSKEGYTFTPVSQTFTNVTTNQTQDFAWSLFEDTFASNANTWIEKDTEDVRLQVEGGKYVFEHKRESGSWVVLKSLLFDMDSDFSIETTLIHESGVTNAGYGLLFGALDTINYYYLRISGGGYFSFVKRINSENTNIIASTKSENINTGDATNTLTVRKIENQIQFFINDTQVG
ncbi:SUMF1/EgtB/PvdO family nonheme iron enzyme, partial [Candidatus Latescibacterota bacterium]